MSNLNISTAGKAIDTSGLKVRELKDNLHIDDAIKATDGNGIDEAFVEANGKRYVIYSGDNFKLDSQSSISIDGKAAKVLKLSNEINSFGEGISYVPGKAYDIAKSALKPVKYIAPNAATGLAIIAGIGAGAISRNAFSPVSNGLLDTYGSLTSKGAAVAVSVGLASAPLTGTIGSRIGEKMSADSGKLTGAVVGTLVGGGVMGVMAPIMGVVPSKSGGVGVAAGAIFGIASVTAAADQTSKSAAAKQIRAWTTGVGSVAVGAAMPEIINLVSKIQIPDLALKGGKVAATAALVGGGMATFGLAAAGALKSAKSETIDEIAK